MSKKKWARCGCCIDWNYEFHEKSKGSQYRLGDDDDVPYRKPHRKKRRYHHAKPDTRCTAAKNHVFVWVKYMQQNYREEKTFLWTYMMKTRIAEPGEFVNRYEFLCVGCGFVKHSVQPTPKDARWRYYRTPVPAEYEIYEVRHLDKYNRLI